MDWILRLEYKNQQLLKVINSPISLLGNFSIVVEDANVNFTIFTIFKYTTQWHLAHSQRCAISPPRSSRIFSSSQEETPYPLRKVYSLLPTPQPTETTNLLYGSMDLPTLTFGINGVLPYVTCVWLLSFSIRSSRLIHVRADIRTSFLSVAGWCSILQIRYIGSYSTLPFAE